MAIGIVEQWLKSLGLSQYAQAFSDNGYDELETCKRITRVDLDAIGVENICHRHTLLRSVEKIRVEGATTIYFTLEPSNARSEMLSQSNAIAGIDSCEGEERTVARKNGRQPLPLDIVVSGRLSRQQESENERGDSITEFFPRPAKTVSRSADSTPVTKRRSQVTFENFTGIEQGTREHTCRGTPIHTCITQPGWFEIARPITGETAATAPEKTQWLVSADSGQPGIGTPRLLPPLPPPETNCPSQEAEKSSKRSSLLEFLRFSLFRKAKKQASNESCHAQPPSSPLRPPYSGQTRGQDILSVVIDNEKIDVRLRNKRSHRSVPPSARLSSQRGHRGHQACCVARMQQQQHIQWAQQVSLSAAPGLSGHHSLGEAADLNGNVAASESTRQQWLRNEKELQHANCSNWRGGMPPGPGQWSGTRPANPRPASADALLILARSQVSPHHRHAIGEHIRHATQTATDNNGSSAAAAASCGHHLTSSNHLQMSAGRCSARMTRQHAQPPLIFYTPQVSRRQVWAASPPLRSQAPLQNVCTSRMLPSQQQRRGHSVGLGYTACMPPELAAGLSPTIMYPATALRPTLSADSARSQRATLCDASTSYHSDVADFGCGVSRDRSAIIQSIANELSVQGVGSTARTAHVRLYDSPLSTNEC